MNKLISFFLLVYFLNWILSIFTNTSLQKFENYFRNQVKPEIVKEHKDAAEPPDNIENQWFWACRPNLNLLVRNLEDSVIDN